MAVVTWVREDVDVERLERGAVITGRDGLDIEQYLQSLEPWQCKGSTERQQRQSGYGTPMAVASGDGGRRDYPERSRHRPGGRLFAEQVRSKMICCLYYLLQPAIRATVKRKKQGAPRE